MIKQRKMVYKKYYLSKSGKLGSSNVYCSHYCNTYYITCFYPLFVFCLGPDS